MKRLIFTLIVCALMATPALANPTSLGWWNENDPRTTHQYWDFTSDVAKDGGTGYEWVAYPQERDNPGTSVAYIGSTTTTYSSGAFRDETSINVMLKIDNYPDPLAYKEIWIDVGFTGTLSGLEADGSGPLDPPAGSGYMTVNLSPPVPGNPTSIADFGFRIYPNPEEESIFFTITGPDAVLDWIHADTICIPAPGAILLGSLGVGLVGWLRRRKSL